MTELDRLIAIEEIKQLKARYFRCVDTKDWAGYEAVFCDDVRFDVTSDVPDGGLVVGAAAAAAIAREGLSGDVVSIHHGHCPEIEITSDTAARAIWAMEDRLYWGPQSAFPGQSLHGMGHYFEAYEKTAAGWRIKSLVLSRLRVEFIPGASAPAV